MKVLIIYDSETRDVVERIRGTIAERFGKSTNLRMNRKNGKKAGILRHAWHNDAKRMIQSADVIVYVVSKNSAHNENVEWELRTIVKYNKYLVIYRADGDADINESLYNINPYSKEKECYAEILEKEEDIYTIIDNYNKDAHIKLFNENQDSSVLLEQYRIFSETAEALVSRRQNMNSFYLSANTALITIGATIFAMSGQENIISKLIIVFALSIPGVLLSLSWKRTIRSYYINNKGKMKILSMIEKKLSASLYDAEWKAMKNKFNKEQYVSFTDSEKNIPLIFEVFYLCIGILALIVLITMFVRG